MGEETASSEAELGDTAKASGHDHRGVRVGRMAIRPQLLDQRGIGTEQMTTDEHADVGIARHLPDTSDVFPESREVLRARNRDAEAIILGFPNHVQQYI